MHLYIYTYNKKKKEETRISSYLEISIREIIFPLCMFTNHTYIKTHTLKYLL